MALKRVHVTFTEVQIQILRRLSAKWGLDVTNTIRHAIMRVAEQELADKTGSSSRRERGRSGRTN